jgi:hypothetical protein
MFRRPKEEGYEVVAITLAALLIFSTLFLTENRAMKERSGSLIIEESGSITETTNALPESGGTTLETVNEVSTIPRKLPVEDIVTTTIRLNNPSTSPVTSFPLIPEDINSEKVLDDLQMDACAAADESGVCRTKLSGLGIVDIDDCCKYLGRCCA